MTGQGFFTKKSFYQEKDEYLQNRKISYIFPDFPAKCPNLVSDLSIFSSHVFLPQDCRLKKQAVDMMAAKICHPGLGVYNF